MLMAGVDGFNEPVAYDYHRRDRQRVVLGGSPAALRSSSPAARVQAAGQSTLHRGVELVRCRIGVEGRSGQHQRMLIGQHCELAVARLASLSTAASPVATGPRVVLRTKAKANRA